MIKIDKLKEKAIEADFVFVAGYTAGGAPYGVRWDDLPEEEQKEWKRIPKVDDEEIPF